MGTSNARPLFGMKSANTDRKYLSSRRALAPGKYTTVWNGGRADFGR